MKHISIIRLVKLAANSDSYDPQESAHLSNCKHCQLILRRFTKDFRKQALGTERKEN